MIENLGYRTKQNGHIGIRENVRRNGTLLTNASSPRAGVCQTDDFLNLLEPMNPRA